MVVTAHCHLSIHQHVRDSLVFISRHENPKRCLYLSRYTVLYDAAFCQFTLWPGMALWRSAGKASGRCYNSTYKVGISSIEVTSKLKGPSHVDLVQEENVVECPGQGQSP